MFADTACAGTKPAGALTTTPIFEEVGDAPALGDVDGDCERPALFALTTGAVTCGAAVVDVVDGELAELTKEPDVAEVAAVVETEEVLGEFAVVLGLIGCGVALAGFAPPASGLAESELTPGAPPAEPLLPPEPGNDSDGDADSLGESPLSARPGRVLVVDAAGGITDRSLGLDVADVVV
jgi:hypothetical protein